MGQRTGAGAVYLKSSIQILKIFTKKLNADDDIELKFISWSYS